MTAWYICMFRASKCSSSGDRIVLIHYLVWLVCVTAWYASQERTQFPPDRHTKQSLTQTNHTRWCINTIRSPDDEHLMLETCREMKLINKYMKKCTRLVTKRTACVTEMSYCWCVCMCVCVCIHTFVWNCTWFDAEKNVWIYEGGRRKFRIEKLQYLYFTPVIVIRMDKSSTTRWARQTFRLDEKRHAYRHLVMKPEGTRQRNRYGNDMKRAHSVRPFYTTQSSVRDSIVT